MVSSFHNCMARCCADLNYGAVENTLRPAAKVRIIKGVKGDYRGGTIGRKTNAIGAGEWHILQVLLVGVNKGSVPIPT